MCNFKSGIILKNKVVLAEGGDESHSTILEKLKIEDNYFGATKKFVRAELVPKDREWWVNPTDNPEHWRFIVDQDIVPEWFIPEVQEKIFREAVYEWWSKHVLVDQKLDALDSGYYMLKRSEVKKLCGDVKVLLGSSTVGKMWESSTVGEMLESSTVGEMWESSTARDFKNWPQIKIYVSDTGKFELVAHKPKGD